MTINFNFDLQTYVLERWPQENFLSVYSMVSVEKKKQKTRKPEYGICDC